jgi:poly(A) polymerase
MARPTFEAELELHRVDCVGSHGDLENYEFLRKKAKEFSAEPLIPPPLIRGRDLLELGLMPGPRIGELLEAVQTAQLEGEIKTREDAFKLLESLGVQKESKGSSK